MITIYWTKKSKFQTFFLEITIFLPNKYWYVICALLGPKMQINIFWNHIKILVTVTQSATNVPQTNNTSTSGMNEE
jgi:hypothetical protein